MKLLIQYKICTTRLVATVTIFNKTMHYAFVQIRRAAILTTATPQFSVIACGKILYILDSDFSENQFRASTLLLQNCTFSRYV